jgi:hypothetical protein
MLQLDAPRKVLGMEQDLNVGGAQVLQPNFFSEMPMSVNEIQQAANCANWAVSIESENLVWRLYSKNNSR